MYKLFGSIKNIPIFDLSNQLNRQEMKLQINIETLQSIIDEVKNERALDNSLSETIEFELIKSTDTWLGNDRFSATLKSGYQECYGTILQIGRKR